MSISKAHIDGEHRRKRAGSFATRPWRNGHVPLPPKGAKNVEIYSESLDEIRERLVVEISAIEESRKLGDLDDNKLVQRLIDLRGHLQRVNSARKSPGWRPLSVTFQRCAELMLDEDVLWRIEDRCVSTYVENQDLEPFAVEGRKMLRQAEGLLSELTKSSAELCASYQDISPLLSAAAQELVRQRKSALGFLDMVNSYAESSRFMSAAFCELSDETLEILLRAADRNNRHIRFRHLVKSVGGRKAYKAICSESPLPSPL